MAPSGFFLQDLIRIVLLSQQERNTIQFGNWEKMLQDLVLKGQNKADQQIDPENLFKGVFYDEQVQMKASQQTQSYQNIEFKFVECEQHEEVGLPKILLNKQLNKFIRMQALDHGQNITLAQHYLQYMCLLSRQLIRDIKFCKVLEFDPYILSAQIDSGPLWGEPKDLIYVMLFKGDYQNLSKDQPLNEAVQYFWAHESNFLAILNIYQSENVNPDLVSQNAMYLDEICMNIPSIYYMLELYKEVNDSLEKVQLICEKYSSIRNNIIPQFVVMQGKLNLMKASFALSIPKDQHIDDATSFLEEAEELFNESEEKLTAIIHEGIAERHFCQALVEIKRLRILIELRE